MAETKPQTFANHTRWDPVFHFFVLPVLVLALILTLVHFFAHITEGDFRDHFHAFLLILLALAFLTLAFKVRLYSIKVQDRVIRLEEQLRLMRLLPEPLRARIPELTVGQLCALRFASDAELPKLAERAMNEKLSRADIKKSIQTWRPDYWRV
jgi:cellulose synthase/poly-beta-1,6-N-acetylglucosamine synthase-like glycosyltransferase